MDIKRPHYKSAPINGENLKLMMKAYYHEYPEGPDTSYMNTAQRMQILATEEPLYHLFSMDDIEAICLKSKPLVTSLTLPLTRTAWTRPGLLKAILHNSVKGFDYNSDENPGFKVFIHNLGKLMNK